MFGSPHFRSEDGEAIRFAGDFGRPMFVQCCDPGRHLQDWPGARAGKCPTECLLSAFGHLARSAPKSAFRALFGAF